MDSSEDEFKAEIDSQKASSQEFKCFSEVDDDSDDDVEDEEFDIFDRNPTKSVDLGDDLTVTSCGTEKSPKQKTIEDRPNLLPPQSPTGQPDQKPPAVAKTKTKAKKPPKKERKKKEVTASKAKSSKTESKASKKPAAPKDPKNVILQYLNQTNRPYSIINIYDNLHRSIPKNLAQKMLDELVSAGEIRMKEYGKAKIYFADQDKLSSSDISPQNLAELDLQAKNLKAQLAQLNTELSKLTSHADTLISQPAEIELNSSLMDIIGSNDEKESRIQTITGSTAPVSPGRKRKICNNFNKYRDLWVKRKRTANDFVATLADGLEKKVPDVEKELIIWRKKEHSLGHLFLILNGVWELSKKF